MNNFRFRLRSEPVLEPKYKAFPYQEEAVEFVATRDYAAIFHEQGLGKTKIAIDVFRAREQTLIAVPALSHGTAIQNSAPG